MPSTDTGNHVKLRAALNTVSMLLGGLRFISMTGKLPESKGFRIAREVVDVAERLMPAVEKVGMRLFAAQARNTPLTQGEWDDLFAEVESNENRLLALLGGPDIVVASQPDPPPTE